MGDTRAAVLWWVVTTLLAILAATKYDAWIAKAHKDTDDQEATREVVPTSFLVVIGIIGTEIFRLVRGVPILNWVPALSLNSSDVPRFLAIYGLDMLTAYAATGLPMIRGDIRRESHARHEAEKVAMRRVERAAEEAGKSVDRA